MSSKFRIGILGIGGVGGYIGATLANGKANDVQVIFIARGDNAKAIRASGIKLITPAGGIIARPFLVSNNPGEIGELNLLICCIKTYDLEESLTTFKDCINENTFVLPLLNGVTAKDTIKGIIPAAKVLDGCIYLVSTLIEPGVVQQSGHLNEIYFGSSQVAREDLQLIEGICKNAGLNVFISGNMSERLWEKFFFISTLATATSYFNSNIGQVRNEPNGLLLIQSLLDELNNVAHAANIITPPGLAQKTFNKIVSLPPQTISSMLNDFRKGGRTEAGDLTGYVVNLGKSHNIPTPTYQMMYARLTGNK
jgi:2-dehydropantoate 2-reductase